MGSVYTRLKVVKENQQTILVTGGAGFIGSAVVRKIIGETGWRVINIDKLTYAGNLESLAEAGASPSHRFLKMDICDREIDDVLRKYQPDKIMHLAAESHVDRSIDGPAEFINTNIMGTYNLFDEQSPYQPNSPYSASKAASDHLVRAWYKTYGIPVLISNCSNNYGPYQFPEKLIPLMIHKALTDQPLPVYGKGDNIRDWLYVEDHADALLCILETGVPGQVYNVGGNNEKTNLQVVDTICELLDELKPRPNGKRYFDLVDFVADRPGHDMRYAIDASKIKRELGWVPAETFESGIRKTVEWYLNNQTWCEIVMKKYRGERLGSRATA